MKTALIAAFSLDERKLPAVKVSHDEFDTERLS